MNQTRYKPSIWAVLAVLILIFTAAACQPAAQPEDTPLPTSTAEATDTPQPVPTTPTDTPLPAPTLTDLSPEAEQVVTLIEEDLARRLNITEEAILVRSIEAVTWSDASLGCPQPGMAYAQILTPGFRVILEAGGQVYEYHTGATQPMVLCGEEGSTMGDALIPGTIEPGLEALIEQAKEDLAERLSVPVEQIVVLEAKAVVWPDSSLGCPQPGMKYRQVPQDGFLIRLAVEGSVYEYHGGGGREMFLCEQPLKLQKDAPPMLDLLTLTPDSPDD